MADKRILYSEEMVGALHPTKSDTLNRLNLVGHNSDGTHNNEVLAVAASDNSNATTTSTCTLDLGTVVVGDVIFVTSFGNVSFDAGVVYPAMTISKSSGTATIVFFNDRTTAEIGMGFVGSANVEAVIGTIFKVSGAGTLVLVNTITQVGANPAYINQIYARFLREQ